MEQRRTRRFSLRLPVSILRSGGDRITETGLTRNISSGGILFTSTRKLEIGGPIEYVIKFPGGSNCQVSLHCVGKVLRNESAPAEDDRFEIAATLERYEFERAAAR